jgi:hypothetical protein
MDDYGKIRAALQDVYDEVIKAVTKYDPMHSAHEAHSVLREEFEELWEHVKVKQGERDAKAMRHESVQVAAMAIRFLVDICDSGRSQK